MIDLLPVLVLLLPALNRALLLGIPLLRSETVVAFCAILVPALFLGRSLRRSREAFRLVGVSAAVALVADWQFGRGFPFFGPGRFDQQAFGGKFAIFLTCMAIVALAVSGLLYVVRRHALFLLTVFFGASLVATVVQHGVLGPRGLRSGKAPGSVASSGDAAAKPPVLLHIILDAAMSPGALPSGYREADDLKKAVGAFSGSLGFRALDHAYSRYHRTVYSIGAAFNFEDLPRAEAFQGFLEKKSGPLDASYRLKGNAYFDLLASRKYEIDVFQTDYLDFCAHPAVRTCSESSLVNPLADGVSRGMGWGRRVANVVFSLVSPASASFWLGTRAVNRLAREEYVQKMFGPYAGMDAIDRAIDQAARSPRGVAIFVHALIPHGPFVWDAGCAPVAAPEGAGFESENRMYLDQATCVLSSIARRLASPEVADRLKDAVIVVHGDHGSRIVSREVRGHDVDLGQVPGVEDQKALFSVLFMHRGPGVAAGRDSIRRSLPSILGEVWGSKAGTGQNPVEKNYDVYVTHGDTIVPQVAWTLRMPSPNE